jgi:DNA (cytosine-5)-methyltransferase 1
MTIYRKNPQIGLWLNDQELTVDNFAGGGGASTGMEAALGRPVDIAINHDDVALSVHTINHPHTKHYCESVFDVNPKEVTKGMPVGIAWFSPDCRHFSRAKGSTPVEKKIRGLAWVALKWAVHAKPRIIMIENVKEFMTWGPLKSYEEVNTAGETITYMKPDPDKKGETFKGFMKKLERAGYKIEYKVLTACDFGAPTSRQRFFLIARRDKQPINWPEPTHGKAKGLKKLRTAAECIDWSTPCNSIFERKKPLADNTCRRIAKGLKKFVIDNPKPFIIEIAHYSKNGKNERVHSLEEPLRTITAHPKGGSFALVAPIIDRAFGTGVAHSPDEPMKTITAGGGGGKNHLVTAWLAKHYTGVTGSSLDEPVHTITQKDHNSLVTAFLVKYYGCSNAASLDEPIDTITTKDRLGLITINQVDYKIVDIGMRMLTPEELYKAQGFPDDYIYEVDSKNRKVTKTKQVAMCGNSVPPPIVEAIINANIKKPNLAMKAA